MVEIHPFGNFVPETSEYLMLGSFVTRPADNYEWFYSNGRNHFWPIMEGVYDRQLKTTNQKQQLFIELGMALADIIYSCERKNNSNLDVNLYNIVFNIDAIQQIVKEKNIRKIFFTSRNVENLFRKYFRDLIDQHPEVTLVTLPSPSPRYANMTKAEKIKRYKELLPKLE